MSISCGAHFLYARGGGCRPVSPLAVAKLNRKPKKFKFYALGPVVQSILSLTSSLRGQLVKCFTTLQPITLIFFVEKMREAFAVQKLLKFFQQKILAYLRYLLLKV